MRIVTSVAGVPIRLTSERVGHIVRRHPELQGQDERMLETVSAPDYVQTGDTGMLMAVRHYARTPLTEKWCVVVYRELGAEDGFLVTAYFTRQPAQWRSIVWRRSSSLSSRQLP